ncbi:MAG: hypothetical protein HRU36_00775 [Rickettsiales bacterium]|nr:hypothetical protein [Rickettsiales bacterium]
MGSIRSRINFSILLEGFVKLNLVLLGVCLILFYVKRLQVHDYFYFMKNQALLVFVTSIVAKFYEWFRYRTQFKELYVRRLSIFYGSLFSVFFLYIIALFSKYLLFRKEVFYLFLYHIVLAITYWFVIIILARSHFMRNLIKFLKTCLEYKDLFKLFLIFNIVCFVAVLIVLMTISRDRSIFETIFIVLYFEISFLIFHLVVAHIVDFIWLPENNIRNRISLCGVCMGSVLYALKFNIIDKKLLGLSTDYDKLLLTAIIALMLFWVFFTLLFHLKWKNLLKRRG